jgi:hypothetical protein
MMGEPRKSKGRRAVFPADLVEEVDKLSPDERRRRLIQYIEEHGEEVEPGEGYGPKVTRPPQGDDPSE